MLVPKETIIPLELKNTLDSKTAYVGENIYCETIFPVTRDNRMLVPAHSWVKGHVTEIDQPGHIVGKAQMSIRMDSLTLPDGETRPIECAVYSLAGARLGISNDTGKDPDKHGDTGNSQHVKNPPSTDNIIDASGLGDAMSLMSATEGVGGLVLLLVSRGKRILLKPGTTMEIRLTAPVDFSPGAPSGTEPPPPHLQHRQPSNSSTGH